MVATLAPPAPAAGGSLKFRSDLSVTRQVQNGEVSYIVKDPTTRKYFRFREVEHGILSRLDGTRALSDILKEVQAAFPAPGIGPEDMAQFLAALKKADLLERTAAEKNLLLLEKLRDQRKQKLKRQSNPLSRALYLHYHLVDPDEFFNRVFPHIRWMWSQPFVLCSLALFAIAACLNVRGFAEIAAGVAALYTFEGYRWFDYAQLWGLSLGAIVLHEFGHGLTCKRFGGEVHDLGFLLLFFNPAMYCNVSDAYTFENKRHKIYVTGAGGFVELWIWAGASIVWAVTFPGTGAHDLAFKLMVVSGVSTLAFNFNPLLKLDGYYALVDFLGVANLRDNSFEFVRNWIKRNVFGMAVPQQHVEPRLARIYAVYGTLAALFSGLMLVVMFFLFRNLILGKMHLAGLPFFLLLIYTLYGSLVTRLVRFLLEVAAARREFLMQPWVRVTAVLACAAALGALFLVQAPVKVLLRFKLDPGARAAVRPVHGGQVAAVKVEEGEALRRGQVVAVLANADLENGLAALESKRLEEETNRARARYQGDLAALRAAEERLDDLRAAIAKVRTDIAGLTLRSPIDGVVLTARPHDRMGDELRAGDTLLEVARIRDLLARIAVPENDVGEVAVGQQVELAFGALPGRWLPGAVRAVSLVAAPASGPGTGRTVKSYEVTVAVPNSDGLLRPGMSGEAKIYGARRPLVGHALHWASKTFNPDFW